MKHSELIHDDISLYIDESESTLASTRDDSKRTSWTLTDPQECGLPPTGKRNDSEHSNGTKSFNRVRMRARPPRTYQLQPSSPSTTPHSISLVRPISFNERLSSSIHRRESSPSIDKSDFLTDTSSISSRICSPTNLRPLLGTYHSSSPTTSAFTTCSKGQNCTSPPLTSQTTSIDTSSDIRVRLMTNDQTDSTTKPIPHSCLKTSKSSGRKKSVHFDCHSPIEIPSSSSLPIHHDEKERTRRTMLSTRNVLPSPLTTHFIHRSFSLSPSSLTKDDKTSSRKHRTQIKEESIEPFNHRRVASCSNKPLNETMTQPIGLNTFLLQNSTKKTSLGTSRKSKRFSADIDSLSNGKTEKIHPINRTSITKTIKLSDHDTRCFFEPVQSSKNEPFYLSTDDSSTGTTTTQTSTLIISTPPQYHYYLYPPSISKKNISMNSISTNSTSSSSSYDLDDDTLSNATYSVINPTTKNSPVVSSDSGQNFWPPPPSPSTLDNDSEDTLIEQNKQSPSMTYETSNESLSMINGNQRDVRPPPKSLNNIEQVQFTYSKPSKIESEISLDDTWTERFRSTSRSINMSRSRSKDCVVNGSDSLRPKSAGSQTFLANDFQSKRQFFENRIASNSPCRHVTKCSWNDLSSSKPTLATPVEATIRTTTTTSQLTLPPTIQRKPVRIVRAVQRSVPNIPLKNHLSSQYIRNLFPISHRTRDSQDFRTISPDDSVINIKKRLDFLTDHQRVINDEIERNTILGNRLMKFVESQAEVHEIEKLKLHINEIETITSVLLKLSCRLLKVENDLSAIPDNNPHTKNHLLEQRDKIREKHEEAKCLKDGIDRRSRLVMNFLRKYFSNEQFDDYEHFIRMKSTLIMDAKDLEENIVILRKQFDDIRLHSHV